jgi:hypothetical protein
MHVDRRYRLLIERGTNLLILAVLADDAADRQYRLETLRACLLRAAALRGLPMAMVADEVLHEARRRLFSNVMPYVDVATRRELAASFRQAEAGLPVRPTIH